MVTSDLGACEWFVWDLRRSGLIDRGQLDQIVSEFLKRNPRAEAPALAEYLVHQSTLTNFQAERILNGKTQGLVLGPYVLLDAIGSGSMGQVYRASSKNDDNHYAVKVLPRRSMWNVRLARRQVRSFGQFNHAAVVPFVDVGTAGGLHYLVWTLAEGSTLESHIQQAGKLPPNQAALYAVQIAQGLTSAHQNNLFHGLLKPSNVMVGSDNQARILDFGIGSLLVENEGESLVDTMSTANTLTSGLDCAAPESIMDPTNRTPAGDQYSLGCILYTCLTGRPPFPEGSAVEKMMAHQLKEPTPVRELAPDVPEALVAVLRKLMAKKPEERYSGCDEVVEALEPFIGTFHDMPGGFPQTSGSGRVAMSAMNRPSGMHPSANGARGGQQGSGFRMPAVPGSNPGNRPPQHGSNPANKPNPQPQTGGYPTQPKSPGSHFPQPKPSTGGGGSYGPPKTTPPPTRPGLSLPSRASFQLPQMPVAEELLEAAPFEEEVPQLETRKQKLPNRAATNWAGDDGDSGSKANFGPVGLVAAALLLMVAVYYGATLLMK